MSPEERFVGMIADPSRLSHPNIKTRHWFLLSRRFVPPKYDRDCPKVPCKTLHAHLLRRKSFLLELANATILFTRDLQKFKG